MNKTSKTILSTISVVMLLSITLYFYQFNDGLSLDHNNWSAFGSYIGGIATIMNVAIFMYLTIVIYRSDKIQKKNELDFQKKLLIAQLRKSEIEKLQRLTSIILEQKGEDRFNAIVALKYALLYLESSDNAIFTERERKLSDEVPFDYEGIINVLDDIVEFHNRQKDTLISAPFHSFSLKMDTLINGLLRKLIRDINVEDN